MYKKPPIKSRQSVRPPASPDLIRFVRERERERERGQEREEGGGIIYAKSFSPARFVFPSLLFALIKKEVGWSTHHSTVMRRRAE